MKFKSDSSDDLQFSFFLINDLIGVTNFSTIISIISWGNQSMMKIEELHKH